MVHSSFYLSAAMCLSLAFSAAPVAAQTAGGNPNLSGGKVKVGVLTDIAGPTSMANGKGSVVAAEMAAEDFGAGLTVEVISADHQGKPDVGSQIAAHWFDVDGVDAIADMQGSPIGFAVQNMAAQKSKIMLLSGSTSSDFSGKACSPLTVQWTVDTYNLAKGAAKSVIEAGGTKWYFLTVDQAYGHALTRDTSEQVKLNGGQVVGNSVFPPNTSDFASFLLTASNAGANVIAIAASSGDTVTALKQADEFGLSTTAKVVPLQSVLTDVHAVGLKIAHNAYEVSPFYWDRTPETRAWAERFYAKAKQMPTGFHAGVYSSVAHYLKAVKAAGTDDAPAVMKQMEKERVHDFFAADGYIRADRKMIHDMYLLQVKKPEESKGEWDLYKVVQTLPGEVVNRPLSDTPCPLVKK
ncbi:ABC transporter substrate-binding protein [Bradyrhizobium sp. INPA03-11B]|uniref:ABC transporter substrate-binding protein n=1 Tax=Bradyrhizobium sp. INPA03-11B TaxID=418598 RepID=UPI00338F8A70